MDRYGFTKSKGHKKPRKADEGDGRPRASGERATIAKRRR